MSGGVLLYVDAKSIKCNEASEVFSAACLDVKILDRKGMLFNKLTPRLDFIAH
jgi:hypothetical protein